MFLTNINKEIKKIVQSKKQFADIKNYGVPMTLFNRPNFCEQLLERGKKIKKLSSLLKWMILVHRLVVVENINISADTLLEFKFNENIEYILKQKNINEHKQFEIFLFKNTIMPYFQYIQKRSLKGQIIKQNINQDIPLQQKLNLCFEYTNLLVSATSFSNLLYIYGRYFKQKYPFIIDMNIMLGIDIRQVYNKLASYIKNIWQNLHKYENNNKQIIRALINRINQLNQSINIIYYNCYYYTYLRSIKLDWIRIQPRAPKIRISSVKNTAKKQSGQSSEGKIKRLQHSISMLKKNISECTTINSIKQYKSNNKNAQISAFEVSDAFLKNSKEVHEELSNIFQELQIQSFQ